MVMIKRRKKQLWGKVFLGAVFGLTSIGLALTVLLVRTSTRLDSQARQANYCSPKSDKLCREKKVGAVVAGGRAVCQDSGKRDNASRTICKYEWIVRSKTCVGDRACSGKQVAEQIGDSYCKDSGLDGDNGRPICILTSGYPDCQREASVNIQDLDDFNRQCIGKGGNVIGRTVICFYPNIKRVGKCCKNGKSIKDLGDYYSCED